jgi:hypothetical protein
MAEVQVHKRLTNNYPGIDCTLFVIPAFSATPQVPGDGYLQYVKEQQVSPGKTGDPIVSGLRRARRALEEHEQMKIEHLQFFLQSSI